MAEELAPIEPGLYRHFEGGLYRVIATGHEVHGEGTAETPGEARVVYRAMQNSAIFGDQAFWVRDPSNFNEVLEVDGKKMQRFTKIEEPYDPSDLEYM